jgi:hypothetical protein
MGLAVRGEAIAPGGRIGPALVAPLLIALLAVVLSRVVVVAITSSLMAAMHRPFPTKWAPVLVWAGLRGAVSLAAALSLPIGLADRDLLVVLTFGVVFFTLLVQGLTIAPLLSRLGLVEAPAPPQAVAGTIVPGPAQQALDSSTVLTYEDLAHHLGVAMPALALLQRTPPLDPANPSDAPRIAELARRLGTDESLLAQLLRTWWTEGLAWALRTYRDRYGLTDAELASFLQMPESSLAVLYHSPHPNPATGDYDQQLIRLAEAADCNIDRLRAVLADVAPEREQPARVAVPEAVQEPPWASES